MEHKIVTVVGGTGFLGRYVVRQLAHAGYKIRVLSRNPDEALPLKTSGYIGQIVPFSANIAEPKSFEGKVEGSYAVINLVGVLFESGKQTFTSLHAKGPEKLAQFAKAAGVERFIHISALGVDKAPSKYARSKMLGEEAVLAAFPDATILRPSVLFGPEDNFFNLFARIASLSPALPLIGGGKTRLQPVYVGDVARAIEASLIRNETKGQVYELGGSHIYTMKEIYEYILTTIGKGRAMMPIPFPLASAMGKVVQILPRPPLTSDQVALLKHDNVVTPGAKVLAHLGIQPTAVDMIVPDYLARFKKGARAA